MTEAWQNRLSYAVIFAGVFGVPLLGCVLAVQTKNLTWLWMLAPLIVFMEGAFVLVPLVWFIVAYLAGK